MSAPSGSRPVEPRPDLTPALGSPAPPFTLRNQHGEEVSLADFRGRSGVLLVFFPFAFTPVCTGELAILRDEFGELDARRVARLAVSCDPGSALKVFAGQEGIDFPLLSDFWPHGEVARRYGVFLESRGFATRGTFLIDTDGILRWKVVEGPGTPRDAAAYRTALALL